MSSQRKNNIDDDFELEDVYIPSQENKLSQKKQKFCKELKAKNDTLWLGEIVATVVFLEYYNGFKFNGLDYYTDLFILLTKLNDNGKNIYKISACWEDRENGESYLELIQILRSEDMLDGRKKGKDTKEVFPSKNTIIVPYSQIKRITHCTIETTTEYNKRSMFPMNAFHCTEKDYEKIQNFKGKKRLSYDDFFIYKSQSSTSSPENKLQHIVGIVGATGYSDSQSPNKKRKSIDLEDNEPEESNSEIISDTNTDDKMDLDNNDNLKQSPLKRLKKMSQISNSQASKQIVLYNQNNDNNGDVFELDNQRDIYTNETDLFDDKAFSGKKNENVVPATYNNVSVLLTPTNNIIYKGVKYERKQNLITNYVVTSQDQRNFDSNKKWFDYDYQINKKPLNFQSNPSPTINTVEEKNNPISSSNYSQAFEAYSDAIKRYQKYKENIPSSEDEDEDYNEIVLSNSNYKYTSENKLNNTYKYAELQFDVDNDNGQSIKKKNSLFMKPKSERRRRRSHGYFIDDVQSDDEKMDDNDDDDYEMDGFVVNYASDVEADEKEIAENHEQFERDMKSMKRKEMRELKREREKQQLLREYDEDNEEEEEVIIVNKKKSNSKKKKRVIDDKEIDEFITSELTEKMEKQKQHVNLDNRDVVEDVNSQVIRKFEIQSQSKDDNNVDSEEEEKPKRKQKPKTKTSPKKKSKKPVDSEEEEKVKKSSKPQPPSKPPPPTPQTFKNILIMKPKAKTKDIEEIDVDKLEVITTTVGKGSKKQIKNMVKGPIDIDTDQPILLTQDKTTITKNSPNPNPNSISNNLMKSNYQKPENIKKQVERAFSKKFTVRESFDIFIQYIISSSLDDEFMYSILENEDDSGSTYFLDSIKKIQDLVVLKKEILVRSSIWQPEFFKELAHRPFYHSQEVDGITGHCKSCKRTKHNVTILVHLSGKSYDVNDLWSGLFHNPKRINEKEEKSIKYELGSFCYKRSNLYHQLHHYPYTIFRSVKKDTRTYQEKHPKANNQEIVTALLSNQSIMDSYFNKLQSLLKSADEIGGL